MGVYRCLYVWLRGQTILVIGGTTHLITDLAPVATSVWGNPWDMPTYDNYPHLLSLHRGSTTSTNGRAHGGNAYAECERLGRPAPVRLWTLPPPSASCP